MQTKLKALDPYLGPDEDRIRGRPIDLELWLAVLGDLSHERDGRPNVFFLSAHFHLEETYAFVALARVGTHRLCLLEMFPRGNIVFVLARF